MVIDGASADATLVVAQAALEALTLPSNFYYHYVSEPDNGIYDAMNRGIAAAQGDYLLFLNADDGLYDDRVLAAVAAELHSSPPWDLMVGDVAVYSPLRSERAVVTSAAFFPDPLTALLGATMPHQASVFRRRMVLELGGFDLNYPWAADYALFLAIAAAGTYRVGYLPRILASYNQDGRSFWQAEHYMTEFLHIQDQHPLLQQPEWRDKRLQKYVEILSRPQGQLGLWRLGDLAAGMPQDVGTLRVRLAAAEQRIAAMERSKFWQLRQRVHAWKSRWHGLRHLWRNR